MSNQVYSREGVFYTMDGAYLQPEQVDVQGLLSYTKSAHILPTPSDNYQMNPSDILGGILVIFEYNPGQGLITFPSVASIIQTIILSGGTPRIGMTIDFLIVNKAGISDWTIIFPGGYSDFTTAPRCNHSREWRVYLTINSLVNNEIYVFGGSSGNTPV